MSLNIERCIRINEQGIAKNGMQLHAISPDATTAADVYRLLSYNYPKFFKMDELCKWAWLCAEVLLTETEGHLYDGLNKDNIAVVIATAHGCLETDKKYTTTISTIPSPALFVYTLPNIMLGEICIRHGFKGEQACLMQEGFDAEAIQFLVSDMLEQRGMDACLCGWADVTADKHELFFCWVTKHKKGIPFTADMMQQLMNS